jgi:4-amino-4-deoxy-L-arabinose transferase-like glycosyltransferase
VRQTDSRRTLGGPWWWLVAWAVLVAVALVVRPLLPVDETRYLSVAWEMWRRGDWLVPSLNGAPYSDKPPLLFWCILLGWRVFGVNEWWPRLLSPLYALVSVLLLLRLSRRLSPERFSRAELALPFMSGALWVTYSTLVLFDTLLAVCVLIALSGVVEALRGHPGQGWLTYGAGLGLGALAKGPVVLVHAFPVALLAPWWAKGSRPAGWRAWYLGVIGALAVAAALGFGWALSAGSHAGRAYGPPFYGNRRPAAWRMPLPTGDRGGGISPCSRWYSSPGASGLRCGKRSPQCEANRPIWPRDSRWHASYPRSSSFPSSAESRSTT